MYWSRAKTGGFTLIELLVVIAIIGILASVVLASLNSARAKSREAQRMAHVKSMKAALQLYFTDNGVYPSVGTDGLGYGVSALATPLVPTYIAEIPADPQGQGWSYVRGPVDAYGIRVYSEVLGGWCKTGMSINPGWWGVGVPECDF